MLPLNPTACALFVSSARHSLLSSMKHKTHSPLALPFEQALEPSNLLAQMTAASEHQLRDQLAEIGNRAFGTALASAKFVLDSGTLQVVF